MSESKILMASNNVEQNENISKVWNDVGQECSKHAESFGALKMGGKACLGFDDCMDDDYIDFEVGSAMLWETVSMGKLNNHRTESREFEFDAKVLDDPYSFVSPADELFYKGQLLPLHLPPRLQMVEKLLATEKSSRIKEENQRKNSLSSMDSRNYTPEQKSTSAYSDDSLLLTPYESCDATPYDSCEASQELNPDLYEGLKENYSSNSVPVNGGVDAESKGKHGLTMLRKAKKLLDSTQSKQTALALKLKASKTYLKSLFSKTGDKDHNHHKRTPLDQRNLMNSTDAENTVSKARGCINRYTKVIKPGSGNGDIDIQREGYKMAAEVARSIHKENSSMIEDANRRKSFSGSLSSIKVAAESYNSNSFYSSSMVSPSNNGVVLKRSSSTIIDTESAIQGAIAHCKQSAHLASKKIEPSNSGHGHLYFKFQRPPLNAEGCANANAYARARSASRIGVCDQPEKPGLCRG